MFLYSYPLNQGLSIILFVKNLKQNERKKGKKTTVSVITLMVYYKIIFSLANSPFFNKSINIKIINFKLL